MYLEGIKMLTLRNYQTESISACATYGLKGGRRALVVLPTGCGKTAIFSHMAGSASKKVLAIAHREELLAQAKESFELANPGKLVEIEQADKHASPEADIVVASIQTLAVSPLRLLALHPADFSLIIVDEAHHSIARTYIEVLHHFGLAPGVGDLTGALGLDKRTVKAEIRSRFEDFVPAPTAPYLLGVTATPSRSDGRGLEFLFDEMVYQRSIKEMVEEGWLAKIIGRRIPTDIDISGVGTTAGDYKVKALSDEVNSPARNALAVNAYRKHAPGRQALVFCVDVQHTIDMCEAFRDEGIKADFVIGDESKMMAPRAEVIAAYKSGDLTVLVNCMVLTEGFDAPNTSALVMARPTKSSLLYTQMLGRGTRIAPGKDDLIVIDLADTAKAGVNNLNTMFGLPPNYQTEGDDVLSLAAMFEENQSMLDDTAFNGITDLADLEEALALFDPLTSAQVEPGLKTSLAWVKTSFGYAVSIPMGMEAGAGTVQYGLVVNAIGAAELRVKKTGLRRQTLGSFASIPQGITAVEDRAAGLDGFAMAQKGAKWRKDSPSAKQLTLAAGLGIEVKPGMSKGDVSTLIGQRLA